MYAIETPTGKKLAPPKGRRWGATEPVFEKYRSEGRVYFPKGGNGRPRIKAYIGEEEGLVPSTVWLAKEVGDTERAKKEILALFPDDDAFDTPKPEQLVRSIISIATDRQDIVLDSFLGSGTTAAVAAKLGRRFIGVEIGHHAEAVAARRLRLVVEGDQGGISGEVGWRGGSGFRFCTLGEPLFDADGNVSPAVSFADLAAHVFFGETGSPIPHRADAASPLIGTFQGRAVYLLHAADAIGVASANAGNVLTASMLKTLPVPDKEFFGGAWSYTAAKAAPFPMTAFRATASPSSKSPIKSRGFEHGRVFPLEILLYQKSEDGETRIDVRLVDETVWLNQKYRWRRFFSVTVPLSLNLHLKNIFDEKESWTRI